MYSNNKFDVDKYVEECLKRINNETERNLRCLSFAKQYFKIERYEEARRYISTYLGVRPNSPEAHSLLGKTLEKLGKKEAALQAYTTSLRLDSKQNNIVIKVCELLASEDVEMDQSGAKYFCEMAQSFDPNNPAIFSLKQRLITSSRDDPQDVSNLFLKELEMRPTDVKLRVRLLKHLLQHNMVKEAYKHVTEIQAKDLYIFNSCISWYETVAEVLIKYQRTAAVPNSLGWQFWFLSVSVLDKLVGLTLEEHSDNVKPTTEYVKALFNFDQTLSTAALNINDCVDKQLIQEFLNHYRAQLCFHLATLLFKQAQKDLIKYKDASNMVLPLLFVAYHSQPPDLQSMWFNHAPEDRRVLVRKWRKEAAFRCSQAGHILTSAARDRKAILLEKANQYSIGMWREQLFKKLFITRDQQLKMKSSYFLTNQHLIEITLRLPESNDLIKYDEEAQLIYPDSLHHHIWIALNNRLSDIKCVVFDGLQYSIKQLKNCGAETLNVLDIQAFIYCATVCARANLDNLKHISYYNSDKPDVLPAAVTQELSTLNQNKFFKAAYKMYKNELDSSVDQLRLTIVDCIRLLRCVDNGLHVKLLIMLAETFASRAKTLTKQSEIDYTETRAEMYWKSALCILEKLKNNQAVAYPPNKLFTYTTKDMSISEICAHIETGKLFSATQLMKRKEYEKALRVFEVLKDPYASFHQAQIYKIMADQQTSLNKENVTSEMRSQNIILLARARDCLYLTLDRLREPSVDQKHPLNAQLGTEIEKIERLLSRIDPDCTNRNECDGMSDENVSSPDSAGDHYVTGFTGINMSYANGLYNSRVDVHNNHSTPYRADLFKREARPSPERLDAQLRQLTSSKDAALSHILEHNKIMVDSHKSLVEELRGFKDAVNNLTSTVEELKTMKTSYEELKDIKKSVNELKNSIEDLDNFKNVTDMLYEMKKEIADLKKDVNKPSQLSEEDIYGLANDYGADYNINASINANLAYNPNLYTNYQARMPAANSLYGAPTIYPGIYPPMAYPYAGMGLPQAPGSLPFGSEQAIAGISGQDFRTISAALSQVQPTVSYGQSLTQSSLPSTTSLGVGLLTGQGLTPVQTQPQPKLFRDQKVPSASTSAPTPVFSTISTPSVISSKAPPINVVITTSDPLPSTKITTSQPILSVTIPPQHLKGNIPKSQAHNYQIPLPTSTIQSTSPSVLSKPPPAISTQSLLSNVAPPVYSAVADTKPAMNVSLGLQIEKSLDNSFLGVSKNDSSLNRSNISSSSVEEHDPIPEFKAIIPLPDEVPVNTGEENETVLFCERSKLYRFVINNGVGEWRERGVGNLKILFNSEANKTRILMRRDQVHKICANHFLTADMNLTAMPQSNCAYIWAAHDFADEEVVVEKLCAKFKSPDEAKKFYDAFENAKKKLSVPASEEKKNVIKEVKTPQQSLGGFVFSATPSFKPTQEPVSSPIVANVETPKASPFAGFTFENKTPVVCSPFVTIKTDFKPVQKDIDNKINNGDEIEVHDDFVPTAEFAPVVPLPDIVEIKTGEENCEVLFESRAKLLRFNVNGDDKEWKERGLGIMKLLKDQTTIRLLMRRDQVHKVCCNHQLLKNMEFKIMQSNAKALTWCAKDFSEGFVKPETFAIRFKNEELANSFLQAIRSAQALLDDDNTLGSNQHHEKHMKPSEPPKPASTGFGDKFKPVKGSWNCRNCYIVNDGKENYCVACETPKNDNVPVKSEESASSGAAFSFGVANIKEVSNSWGSAFKTKEGSWECKSCYTRNDEGKQNCASCEAPKDGVSDVSTITPILKTVNLDTGNAQFSFGVPASDSKPKIDTAKGGWGDAFKPKTGNWECKLCYVSNKQEDLYCISCENPKDESVPKKEARKGVNLDTDGQKFTFGMPVASSGANATATFTFGESSVAPSPFSSFGGLNLGENKSSLFSFKPTTSVTSTTNEKQNADQFIFGSPQKHDFGFMPRSPRTNSTGQKEEESDNSILEEECDNIYFKPVIPLPDVVEVKTGEEEEEALYCHRAKLFRFTGGEWKERGLGDIKILKRKDTGKLRVVMRREQVFKICLNHHLNSDVKYIAKGDNAWLFCVPDFSEGEITNEKFCLRFKTAEIADEFIKAVNNALNSTSSSIETDKTKGEEIDDDSEVEFISETKVTSEEEQEAIKLGLPPKFMAYRQLPDCDCAQCKKDDIYLKEQFTKPSKIPIKSIPISTSFGKSSVSFTATTSLNNTSTGSTIFGTPKESFTSPAPTSSTDTIKGLLTKPSLLATPPTSSSFDVSKTFSSGNSSNIFGTPTTISNFFGNKSSQIFGGATTPTQTNSSSLSNFSFTSALKSAAGPATTTESKSIFGGGASFDSTNTSIFGGGAAASTPPLFTSATSASTPPLFENVAPASTPPLFAPTSRGVTSVFGGKPAAAGFASTPVFGSVSATTPNESLFKSSSGLFSVKNESTPTLTSPLFKTGGSIFGGATSVSPSTNIFGGAPATIAPSTGFGKLVFGSGDATIAAKNREPVTTVKELKESDAPVLDCSSGLSFASLAAKSPPTAFSTKSGSSAESTTTTPFAFLGAGAPVFGASKADKNKSTDDGEETKEDEEYDPHYEPIVPLPDAIVVSTGEEDETTVFNERAKLFRYDANNKEWKERGVGQMKILHHPQNNTYRFLLRREQVHKVVLNQLIVPDLDMQPMSTSDKAWVWAGYNYTDDNSQLEKLAIRFKNCELAQNFFTAVQEVIGKVKQIQANKDATDKLIPASIQNYGVEDVSSDEHQGSPDDDDEDDDDDDEDEDDRSVIFMKRCTLSEEVDGAWKTICMGDLQVYYDPEMYAARICVNDDSGLIESNTMIATNTQMQIDKNSCTWRGVEWAKDEPKWRTLKATFSSNASAEEFHCNYLEGYNYAQEYGVVDEIPEISDEETEN